MLLSTVGRLVITPLVHGSLLYLALDYLPQGRLVRLTHTRPAPSAPHSALHAPPFPWLFPCSTRGPARPSRRLCRVRSRA